MHVGKLVFAQLMDHLPWKSFGRIVQRYRGDHRIRDFSCANQFRCMAFAQLTYRDSPRDIVTCLRAQSAKLYHLGIRGVVARSTLADANEARDWLAENGYDRKMGARPMARLIREKIRKPLAEDLLFGRLVNGGHVTVTVRDGELAVEVEEESAVETPA